MSAPRREYDPKRRPDIFYKGDEASNDELYKRAYDRKQLAHQENNLSISEQVSRSAGIQRGLDVGGGPVVTKGGKKLEGIYLGNRAEGSISDGSSRNMPISGTQLGKWSKIIGGANG